MSKKAAKRSNTKGISSHFLRIAEKGGITEYRFKPNGLRILYVPVFNCDTVTTCIVYGVGSQHEGKGETGLAHMLEHMLFKDTGTKGPTWKSLEEKGAVLNATTWLDRTLYYFNMPAQYLGEMLAVEADRMRNTRLTRKEFEPERANVLSEYQMNNNSPDAALDWNVVATAFQSHGYHHDTIGFKTDIENYTTHKLQSFYDRYYWPDNATLIVAGDITKQTLFQAVHGAFGKIRRARAFTFPETIAEMPQEGTRRVVLERDTPMRVLTLAWKAPAFKERAWTALFLGLHHLTDGTTCPLHKALVDSGKATSVSGSLYPTKDPFLAFLNVTASEHTPYAEIERIIYDEIESILKKGISAKRVRELITHAHASELFSRDGTLNIASQLAEYVASGDWKRYDDGLNELLTITPGEIQDAMKMYLVSSRATVGTIEKTS